MDFNLNDLDFNLDRKPLSKDTSPVATKVIIEGMPNGIDTNSETARKLVAKEAELKALEDYMAPLQEQHKRSLAKQKQLRADFEAAMEKLHAENIKIQEELYDARKKLKALRAEIDALRRLLLLEFENLQRAKEFKDNALTFSKRMANYAYSDKILPHQREGACILANSGRAILGDKRGLGKTLTVIAALDALQAQKVLVVAPDDVFSNFINEINYWAPHRQVIPVGKMPKSQREIALGFARGMTQFIVVINYSAWRKDESLIKGLKRLCFDTVICDEAHQMKNASSLAFRGVREIVMAENVCPMCRTSDIQHIIETTHPFRSYDMCKQCDWNSASTVHEWEFLDRCSVRNVFPMTGTVILNKPEDLYPLLHLIDPLVFDTQWDFQRMYCERGYDNKWHFQEGGLERLTKRLSGKYLARDESTAGVKRPKQNTIVHEIELDQDKYRAQSKVIKQLTQHAQIILDSGSSMKNLETITLILRKRQANVWPAGIRLKDSNGNVVFSVGDEVRESIKLDKIIASAEDGMIPEFTENGDKELGARVIVFSQFKEPLEELENRCNAAGISVVRLDGSTHEKTKAQIKLDFDRRYCEATGYNGNRGYKWQVLLCNYKTGGAGLNFNAATESIFLDEEWNPGMADQATGRTDRMGQTQENNVHILRLANSIDTWMVQLNDDKRDMISGFEASANGQADALLLAMRNGDII